MQIDHVQGDGKTEIGTGGNAYYTRVMRAILAGSTAYQILCANCNWIKRAENREARGRYQHAQFAIQAS